MVTYLASLNPATLLSRLPGGIAQGILWGIMALGVYITFRILNEADLTVDGTFTTGGAVAVMLIISGWNAWLVLPIAAIAGAIAGAVTGLAHTVLGIPVILSGILTQFALYSINLAIMGMKANRAVNVNLFPLAISSRNVNSSIMVGSFVVLVVVIALFWYFTTEKGAAVRATGCNPQMSRAQGINISKMKVAGLMLSNALVALSGALMAQFQGFADINMGRGAIVIGLAAVIIGEVLGSAILERHLNLAGRFFFVSLGGVIYYMAVVFVLWLKLDSNMLKLLTAIIVAIFLAVPHLRAKSKNSFARAGRRAAMFAVDDNVVVVDGMVVKNVNLDGDDALAPEDNAERGKN